MSTERNKNPLKRDQALNDATNEQLGEQPRPKLLGRGESPAPETHKSSRDSHIRTARKMSREM
jgi:hypothetical protein